MRFVRALLGSVIVALAFSAPNPPPVSASWVDDSCWISAITAPHVVSGPAIRAKATVSCHDNWQYIGIKVRIWMKGGNCATWCRVAYTTNVEWYTDGPVSVTATTGKCAGTRQYYASIHAYWDSEGVGSEKFRDTFAYTLKCS